VVECDQREVGEGEMGGGCVWGGCFHGGGGRLLLMVWGWHRSRSSSNNTWHDTWSLATCCLHHKYAHDAHGCRADVIITKCSAAAAASAAGAVHSCDPPHLTNPYYQAAARIVLQDWNEGRIPYYTLPPKERPNQQFESAEIVTGWATEFDADK